MLKRWLNGLVVAIKDQHTMNHILARLSAVALAGFLCVGTALAQTPSPPPAANSPSTTTAPSTSTSPATTVAPRTVSSTVADVEKWTTDEWDAAKAKWSKENTKWAECEQQATEQKLTGRDSWVFLYKCIR